MLTRICLIVAILAGLAAGALNFIKVKEKITTLQTVLSDTKTELASTQATLRTTESNLKKTTADLASTTKKFQDASAERDKANADKIAAEKRMQKAVDDLATANTELKDARSTIGAYQLAGLSPEQAMNASQTIKDLNERIAVQKEENRTLVYTKTKLEAELAFYRTPDIHPTLPANLQGTVMVYDPKWDFVVVNVGADQQVVENAELLINRNGKLIAKVVIRSVQKDRCIANVVPGWKIGELLEGDSAIPAKPASS
jgi:hypothetical protein